MGALVSVQAVFFAIWRKTRQRAFARCLTNQIKHLSVNNPSNIFLCVYYTRNRLNFTANRRGLKDFYEFLKKYSAAG